MFEYTTVNTSAIDERKMLAEYAAEGWELVAVNDGTLYFKRKKSEPMYQVDYSGPFADTLPMEDYG